MDDFNLNGTASTEFQVTVVDISYGWAYAVFGLLAVAMLAVTVVFLVSVLTVRLSKADMAKRGLLKTDYLEKANVS